MISSYGAKQFKQKLNELMIPRKDRSTGAYHIANPYKRPFKGRVSDSYFNFTATSFFLASSYYIEGTYSGDEKQCDVKFRLKRDPVYYVAINWVPVGVYGALQIITFDKLDTISFLKVQIPLMFILAPILIDLYYRNILVNRFYSELKIK